MSIANGGLKSKNISLPYIRTISYHFIYNLKWRALLNPCLKLITFATQVPSLQVASYGAQVAGGGRGASVGWKRPKVNKSLIVTS